HTAEGFSETIRVAQRTFEKLKLRAIRDGGVQAQAHADGLLLQPQTFEVRVQDAEQHSDITRGRGNGESALIAIRAGSDIRWTGLEEDRERHLRRHAPGFLQPQRELLELAAQDEKQRLGRLDGVLKFKGFPKYFRWPHE